MPSPYLEIFCPDSTIVRSVAFSLPQLLRILSPPGLSLQIAFQYVEALESRSHGAPVNLGQVVLPEIVSQDIRQA